MLAQVDAQATAMMTGALVAQAMGAKVEIRGIDEARATFMDWLVTPPKEVDPDKADLIAALFPRG